MDDIRPETFVSIMSSSGFGAASFDTDFLRPLKKTPSLAF
jgi:hypothetical protein